MGVLLPNAKCKGQLQSIFWSTLGNSLGSNDGVKKQPQTMLYTNIVNSAKEKKKKGQENGEGSKDRAIKHACARQEYKVVSGFK